jgi:hypothetical protein
MALLAHPTIVGADDPDLEESIRLSSHAARSSNRLVVIISALLPQLGHSNAVVAPPFVN